MEGAQDTKSEGSEGSGSSGSSGKVFLVAVHGQATYRLLPPLPPVPPYRRTAPPPYNKFLKKSGVSNCNHAAKRVNWPDTNNTPTMMRSAPLAFCTNGK